MLQAVRQEKLKITTEVVPFLIACSSDVNSPEELSKWCSDLSLSCRCIVKHFSQRASLLWSRVDHPSLYPIRHIQRILTFTAKWCNITTGLSVTGLQPAKFSFFSSNQFCKSCNKWKCFHLRYISRLIEKTEWMKESYAPSCMYTVVFQYRFYRLGCTVL